MTEIEITTDPDAARAVDRITAAVRQLLVNEIPAIGGGATARRWLRLYRWARSGSVSVARLAEAHLDAVAILAEAGLGPEPAGGIYGVWASGPASTAALAPDGRSVCGSKPFCSGVGLVDRALVSVVGPGGEPGWLVEVDASKLAPPARWASPALVDTFTGAADLSACELVRIVGVDNWYLARPGFWHGALGPAACWAGAAAGLIDAALEVSTDDPHRLAANGELASIKLMLESVLAAAGNEADEAPHDSEAAHRRALATRHVIERGATRAGELYGQAVGPRPFVQDPELAQRQIDLHLYLRQHHGPRDLEQLGRLLS